MMYLASEGWAWPLPWWDIVTDSTVLSPVMCAGCPEVPEADWSSCFGGLVAAAVATGLMAGVPRGVSTGVTSEGVINIP